MCKKRLNWYQPIYQIETGEILGYEALVRNKSLNKLSPLDIFKQAEQEGCRTELDSYLLFQAINSVSYTSNLFLNVFPSTLLEKWFLSWWDEHFVTPAPLVIEISESEPVNDWKALKSVITKLRKRGVKIAVDDMGSGYSFFQHWVELNPDYIKLDCYYAAGLAENSLKQRIIKYLTKLFDGYSIIILEGIETEEDLNIAKQLGISYARAICLGDRPHGRVFLYKIIILEITGKMDVGERKFFGNFHQHGQTHLPFSPFQLAEVITGYAQKLRQLVPC